MGLCIYRVLGLTSFDAPVGYLVYKVVLIVEIINRQPFFATLPLEALTTLVGAFLLCSRGFPVARLAEECPHLLWIRLDLT